MKHIILKASNDKILTNGEIYGDIIFLAADRNPEDFHEISLEEYEQLKSEEENGQVIY